MEEFGAGVDQVAKNESEEYQGLETHETDTPSYADADKKLQKTIDGLMEMDDTGESIRVLVDTISSFSIDFHDEGAVPDHVSSRMRNFAYNSLIVNEDTFLKDEVDKQDFTEFEKDRCIIVMNNIVERVDILHLHQSLTVEVTGDLDELARFISNNNELEHAGAAQTEGGNEDPLDDGSIDEETSTPPVSSESRGYGLQPRGM